MPRKQYSAIDMVQNELLNVRAQNLGSAPGSPVTGQFYYDTGTSKLGVYNGATWDYMGTGGGTGTVTSVSVVSTNGFAGSVATSTTTPAITITTTITGMLKGNGTAISAASAGTDYSAGTSALATGILKSTTTTGALTIAVAGDFPTLNQSTTGSAATLSTPRAIYGNNFDGSAAITAIIASTYGGTGNGFTKFSGPASTEKTFTLPNASATILTDNAAVTVAQGGTGRQTSTTAYGLIAAGTTATGAHQTLAAGATTEILVGGGASALPVWTTASGTGAPVRVGSPALTGTPTAPTAADGTNTTQIATTAFVTSAVSNGLQGLSWKQAVRAVSTANVTIASALINASTIDGVTLATGDRVLLKDQSTASQNGIYVVVASGAASRAIDADTSAEIDSMTVFVEEGTVGADTVWALTTNNPTLGSTSLVYAQVNGGTVPVATTSTQGKVQLATQAEAQAKSDTAKALTAASVADFTRKYVGTIGNGSLTDLPVTHGLGSQYVTAQVFDATSNALVECDVVLTSSTVVTFTFTVAPTTNQFRVVIVG